MSVTTKLRELQTCLQQLHGLLPVLDQVIPMYEAIEKALPGAASLASPPAKPAPAIAAAAVAAKPAKLPTKAAAKLEEPKPDEAPYQPQGASGKVWSVLCDATDWVGPREMLRHPKLRKLPKSSIYSALNRWSAEGRIEKRPNPIQGTSAPFQYRIVRDSKVEGSKPPSAAPAQQPEKKTSKMSADDRLLAALQGTWMTKRDLHRRVSTLSGSKLKVALARLVDSGDVEERKSSEGIVQYTAKQLPDSALNLGLSATAAE
ncbi:MAG TPA: hypothetical protein VFQ61_06385 [Polyangiaceae bacterium]|nr:hypothetical protein [Polyangiaceae bacterium]